MCTSCGQKLDDMMLVLLWLKEQVQINQKMVLKQQNALQSTIDSAIEIREDVRSLRAGVKDC